MKTAKRLVESDILSADVICIVYSVDEPETFNHIKSFWLPEVRRIRAGKPVRSQQQVV